MGRKNDERIVALYLERSERAIDETAAEYGRYCRSIAYSLLGNKADAEECVNDVYLAAWNSIPPHRPSVLSAFLGKITRRIAVDRIRHRRAEKRGGGEYELMLSELEECLPDGAAGLPYDECEEEERRGTVNRFLASLPEEERRIFLMRYFYGERIAAISESFGYSESKVKSMLFRTREKLRRYLAEEGYDEIP